MHCAHTLLFHFLQLLESVRKLHIEIKVGAILQMSRIRHLIVSPRLGYNCQLIISAMEVDMPVTVHAPTPTSPFRMSRTPSLTTGASVNTKRSRSPSSPSPQDRPVVRTVHSLRLARRCTGTLKYMLLSPKRSGGTQR